MSSTSTGLNVPEVTPVASLTELLDRIRPEDGQDSVSVHEILERIGNRSFDAALLVPALILVSPISGIPGAPTIGGLVILLIAAQNLVGRRHLWLPGFLMRRRIGAERLENALGFLRKPAAWVDRHSRNRWRVLTRRPVSSLALLTIIATTITWPLLELVPFFTSAGAVAVSLFAIGLMIRDGLYMIAGYVCVSGVLAVAFLIWQGLV
ncbi:exopolysaccharide biosynthesis protein [Roseivivax isoporae]|uniref:Exopolysaccharide biosynthesis protein n=1 Tax=Roseivivax isoporae LMG 25204 TaxID=1449351 RepID=X7F5C4_9RHOB|nr:exopolysaccharide biosynthesis protein [Roseivivax isoporae]ETX27990.1 hypothetical protein RISW2_10260 [Roseivivax isoporae LMG 25204]